MIQGAFVSLVVFVVWNGRRHLALVLRRAIQGDPTVDDSDEIMSYRSAFLGFVLCFAYLCAFQFAVGMSAPTVAIFMFGVLVLFIGMTRIIIESGVITLRAPQSPQDLSLFTLGTQGLTQANLIGVAMSVMWVGDLKTTIMPVLAHTTKLHQSIQRDKRKLLWSILVGHGHRGGDNLRVHPLRPLHQRRSGIRGLQLHSLGLPCGTFARTSRSVDAGYADAR